MHSLTRRYGLLAVPFGVLVGHLVGYRLAHPGASSRDAALGSTHGYLGVSTWVGLALAIVALGLAAREGARGQRSGFTAATLLRAGVVVPGVLIAGATAGWRKALALGALLLVVVSVLQAVGIAMAPGSTGSALTRLFAGGVYIIPASIRTTRRTPPESGRSQGSSTTRRASWSFGRHDDPGRRGHPFIARTAKRSGTCLAAPPSQGARRRSYAHDVCARF